jgi:hypothetical protein
VEASLALKVVLNQETVKAAKAECKMPATSVVANQDKTETKNPAAKEVSLPVARVE